MMSKSCVQAESDFVFVQNNVSSPQEVCVAKQFPRRQGNTQHHQYDNVDINELRTFKHDARNLDGQSSGVTPPPAAIFDATILRMANSDQDIEVLYAKPTIKRNRSNAPTVETMSTDRTDIKHRENYPYQSETMGDDMVVVENDLYDRSAFMT